MKDLTWREYMRELLKMSDDAILKMFGGEKFHRDLAEEFVNGSDFEFKYSPLPGAYKSPTFTGVREHYIKITPKIKVEFECEKPAVIISKTSYSYNGNILSIDGSVDGKDCVLYCAFNSQEEQEKVFKQLIEAFGG